MTVEPTAVLVDGPWTHRDISANGTRLHVAECAPQRSRRDGSPPLVLFVHGFPEFWWSWRHQLEGLAAAGFRTVACDLRGYGASDKPPRGYDVFTLAEDIAGLIRALGERDAVLVGHDWGGFLAWVTAALRPDVVRRLAVLSIPHPLAMRAALRPGGRAPGQSRASTYILGFQLPWRPERRLVASDAELVGRILRKWGGPGFPDRETERRNREAMQIPGVAHCSMEYYRWAFRSQFRPDGHRMVKALAPPITVPTLQIHGAVDSCILPAAARRSRRHVAAPYEWRLLESVGHFPHQEAPRAVNELLIGWADGA